LKLVRYYWFTTGNWVRTSFSRDHTARLDSTQLNWL